MIKAIIFDCFGVLSGTGFGDTYTQAGGNLTKDISQIQDLLGATNLGKITSEEFNHAIADLIGIPTEQWTEILKRTEKSNVTLFEYIETLKPKYKIGLLSNANHGVVQSQFTPDQFNLFDDVVVSAEVGLIKPDPEIYKLAAERLDEPTENCVFVDNNDGHCGAARSTGMQAVLYQTFDQFKTDLAKLL